MLLPLLAVNELGMGDPFFCKYLCPQGVLEGALPLSLTNAGIRAAPVSYTHLDVYKRQPLRLHRRAERSGT